MFLFVIVEQGAEYFLEDVALDCGHVFGLLLGPNRPQK